MLCVLKVVLLVAVLSSVCLHQCNGFYLPGVAPTDFVVVGGIAIIVYNFNSLIANVYICIYLERERETNGKESLVCRGMKFK